jgi:hypothetical protein
VSLAVAILPDGLPDPGMPVPDSVQVIECLHQPTTYRLRYAFASKDGDFPLLSDSHLEPEKDLAVAVMPGTTPTFLVCGPVARQEVTFMKGGSDCTLDVVGGDHCIAMDREDKSKIWNNVTDSLAVTAVLVDYKLVPDISVTTALHTEFKHSLVQRETDLRFVRRLARRNGFWFWITSEAPAVNVAHFKRFSPGATADVELRMNGKDANIDKVSLEWDSERPVAATLKQVNLSDKSVIDGSVAASPLTGLASKALGSIVSKKRAVHLVVPADDAGDLKSRAEALLIDNGWFVTARVVTRLSVLKKVLRSHTVASLGGLGKRHSGNYVVARVVHDIDATDHVMTADLVRNGWN